MTEASRGRIHREFETENVEWISAATTLRPGSRCYIIDVSAAAVAVTLPDIAESVGNILSFQAPAGASYNATVVINETAATLITMDANNEYAVIFNNGLQWVTLVSSLSL